MEPILLITSTLTILSPFIQKAGEKYAEQIGEDVWSWIKKSLSKGKGRHENLELPAPDGKGEDKFTQVLMHKINSDKQFKDQLEKIVKKAQSELSHYEQHIENQEAVEKQINIQHNTGDIRM